MVRSHKTKLSALRATAIPLLLSKGQIIEETNEKLHHSLRNIAEGVYDLGLRNYLSGRSPGLARKTYDEVVGGYVRLYRSTVRQAQDIVSATSTHCK